MKHEEIYAELLEKLSRGAWKPGERLPPDRDLAQQYGVSRPTISRVLNRLQDGLLVRRVVGAGTFRSEPQAEGIASKTLGLFVPGLGRGEIFEHICGRIAELSHQFDFSLIWGSIPSETDGDSEAHLRQTALRFIADKVDGVFLQPLEREPESATKNLHIISLFERARIPIVLLDSDYVPYPARSDHDLVGIDNIQAAYVLTDHFLRQRCNRVDFLWQPNTAGTYMLRLIGYRNALIQAGINPGPEYEHEGDARDASFVGGLVRDGARQIICVNDETAANLMKTVESLGFSVPQDVRVAGFDDLKFARLAHVPLTSMHQPCRALGELALSAMLSRMGNPSLPPRTITASATLSERDSSRIPPERERQRA